MQIPRLGGRALFGVLALIFSLSFSAMADDLKLRAGTMIEWEDLSTPSNHRHFFADAVVAVQDNRALIWDGNMGSAPQWIELDDGKLLESASPNFKFVGIVQPQVKSRYEGVIVPDGGELTYYPALYTYRPLRDFGERDIHSSVLVLTALYDVRILNFTTQVGPDQFVETTTGDIPVSRGESLQISLDRHTPVENSVTTQVSAIEFYAANPDNRVPLFRGENGPSIDDLIHWADGGTLAGANKTCGLALAPN